MVNITLTIILAACEPPVDTCPWQDTNQTLEHNQTQREVRPPGDFASFHDYMIWHSKREHVPFDMNTQLISRRR